MKALNHHITKVCFIAGFCFSFFSGLRAQEQRIADSLKKIYDVTAPADTTRLELLRNLSFNEVNDLHLALAYAEELIQLSKQLNNPKYLYRGYLQKGNKKRLLGLLEEALDAYLKAVDAARLARYTAGEALSYSAIADVYSTSEHHSTAITYYKKAIATFRKTTDTLGLATALINAGDEYLKNKNYKTALRYFNESKLLFEQINYLSGKAYSLGNMGMVYANTGKNNLAERYINEAIKILEAAEDNSPICEYLISMCTIYRDKEDMHMAMNYAKRSLVLAQRYGLKEQISNANLKLYELYEKEGKASEALKYYKAHIAYRDSVNNINTVQKMADLRTNFEVSQKQAEVDLLNVQKKNQRIVIWSTVIVLVLIGLLAGGLQRRNILIKRTNKIIDEERSRSDQLLLNILPEETARELKQSGKVVAKRFDSVTILFTDFKGFTHYAENLPPEELVESVDHYFSKFDEIIERHYLEKIKTVGDSYMCAGGLHSHSTDHATKMVEAALEILQFVQQSKNNQTAMESRFDIRIGINTGPVVAGVVGFKKIAYDIWGDAVNVASRMESNSMPNRINISHNTYELIKDKFDCECRGELEVKNHGLVKMYFVNGVKKAAV